MKYIVILVTLFLGESIKVNSQPIQPYLKKGYSPTEVKTFALGSSQLSTEWRTNMLEIVNSGLDTTNNTLNLDQTNVAWVLDNVKKEKRSYAKGFINSEQSGQGMRFFPAENPWNGDVWVFRYKNCSIDLYKDTCTNLLKIPVSLQTSPTNPNPTLVTTAANGQPIYITINNNPTVTVTGNNNGGDAGGSASGEPVSGQYTFTREVEVTRPYYREQVIYPRQNVWQIVAGATFNVGGGQQRQQQQVTPNRRGRTGSNPVINPSRRGRTGYGG